jgi:hypothetical protein
VAKDSDAADLAVGEGVDDRCEAVASEATGPHSRGVVQVGEYPVRADRLQAFDVEPNVWSHAVDVVEVPPDGIGPSYTPSTAAHADWNRMSSVQQAR